MVKRCGTHRLMTIRMGVVLFALSAGNVLFAESVGSPASILKKGQWAMGLSGGALLSRDMTGGPEAVVYQGGHFRGYGLTDWLSVYGKIGGAYIEVDDPSIIKANDPSTKNDFGGNILVSVQVKGKLWESVKTGWEWDGSIQYVDLRARHKGKNEGRWHEWQFASSVAKSFGRVKPYLGLRYSIVEFTFKVRENGNLLKQGKYKEDGAVGPVLGTDVYFGEGEDFVVNVEGSYVGGLDAGMAITYTF